MRSGGLDRAAWAGQSSLRRRRDDGLEGPRLRSSRTPTRRARSAVWCPAMTEADAEKDADDDHGGGLRDKGRAGAPSTTTTAPLDHIRS